MIFFVKAPDSLFIVVCQCECLTCEYEFGISMEDKIVMRDKQSRGLICGVDLRRGGATIILVVLDDSRLGSR